VTSTCRPSSQRSASPTYKGTPLREPDGATALDADASDEDGIVDAELVEG
jgi:hypothetical protein